MSLRKDFIQEVLSGELSKSKLCAKYGISRVTGDKWLKRYFEGNGLSDKSRKPFRSPNKTPAEVENLILEAREAHKAWGPRKLVTYLRNEGYTSLPSPSTVCTILKRNGLVSQEASQASTAYKRFVRELPNQLWQADFKGNFKMENGLLCFPLAIIDDCSKFSFCLDAKANEQGKGVHESFLRIFELYGLPLAILCDNGNPWGVSQSVGYTRFDVWFMQLDILPIHGRPGHPQTQGKVERFNRTLNEEVLKYTTIKCLGHAQKEFDEFRDCYNNVRPHGALDLNTPASRHTLSKRPLPKTIQEWIYPSDYIVRKVRGHGDISLRRKYYYLGDAFIGLHVGLRESSISGCFNVYYRNFRVARIKVDEKGFLSRRPYRVEEDD